MHLHQSHFYFWRIVCSGKITDVELKFFLSDGDYHMQNISFRAILSRTAVLKIPPSLKYLILTLSFSQDCSQESCSQEDRRQEGRPQAREEGRR